MKTDTPETDEAKIRVDCDDSCVTIYTYTQDESCYEGDVCRADVTAKLERERNAAVESLAKLKDEYADLVDRFNNTTSRQLDTIQAQEIKIGNLRAALAGRTVSCSQCNETTKQLDAMRDELQKVGQQRDAWAMRCDKLGVEAMREAIKEAYKALERCHVALPDGDDTAWNAISKLQPFLKP